MNKKNIILGAFVMINAMLVASISVSLAWYGSSSRLSVDNLNISFVGEKNLQVSLTDSNFKDEINDSDLGKVEPFTPVSSMYQDEWITAKAEKPVFKGAFLRPSIDRPNTFKKPSNATSGYYSQELYLYSDYDLDVTLDITEPLIIEDEEANKKQIEKILIGNPYADPNVVLKDLNNIKKSMRVSILDPDPETYSYTLIDPYKEGDTYLCGRLSLFSGDYYDSYIKDNEKFEYVYGQYTNDDKIIYDQVSSEASDLTNKNLPASVFNAKTKANVHGFNFNESIKNGFKPQIEDSISQAEVKDKFVIPITRFTPKRLIVSIYVEGWDLDNTDNAKYGSFISNIKFKIARER